MHCQIYEFIESTLFICLRNLINLEIAQTKCAFNYVIDFIAFDRKLNLKNNLFCFCFG